MAREDERSPASIDEARGRRPSLRRMRALLRHRTPPRAALAVLGAAALLLASTPAHADERFDHRGAVGLLLGSGAEVKDSITLAHNADSGWRVPVDVGGTYAVGYNGNEVIAFARVSFLGSALDTSIAGGYRGYFGEDRFKTFVDLGASVHFTPALVAGPRFGLGAQYELTSNVGIYSGLAAQLGFGNGIRFDGELLVGVQLRSYLLE